MALPDLVTVAPDGLRELTDEELPRLREKIRTALDKGEPFPEGLNLDELSARLDFVDGEIERRRKSTVQEAFHLRGTHWLPVPSSGRCPSTHSSKLKFPGTDTLRCFRLSAARAVRAEMREQERPSLKAQTYILSKERFKTQGAANKWMDDNDVPRPKVDETENSFRYRQFPPERCQEGSERTTRITDGVQIVGCRLKPQFREQAEKLTNDRSNLREANPDNPTERCGFCTYFREPTGCQIVEGPVGKDLVCDWIFSRETEAGLYEISDDDWLAFVKGMIDKQPYQHIVKDGAITPEGPVVMIEDTAEPPHRFSLTKKFHVEHTCVDEKTRAVTPEGLKNYEDLRIGDSVFCLDKRTGKLVTAPIKQIMVHPHDGKLIHWQGHKYNFAVTPNHRVYCHLDRDHDAMQDKIELVDDVRSMVASGITYKAIGKRIRVPPATISRWCRGRGDIIARRIQETQEHAFDVVEAKDLRRRYQFFLPAPTGYEDKPLRPIRLPKESGSGPLVDELPVDLFLRLAGWYVAEGWSSVKYGTFNLAAKKEDSVREIDSLLAQLGCHYRYSKIQFIIYRVALARLFGGLFGKCAGEKRVPEFIKSAPRKDLWTFLLCYLRGDGTLLDTGSWSATTVSPRLRDDLAEIAWKLGFVPGVWTKPAGRRFVIRKHYDCKEAYLISASPTLSLPRGAGYSVTNISGRERRWSYLDHKGTVWCPVVEDHENWLAERDGKYVFTGNSLEHHWTQAEVDALVDEGKEEVQESATMISGLVIGRRKEPAPFEQLDMQDPKTLVEGQAALALWRRLIKAEESYAYRVAILNDAGKLQEMNARARYTPDELNLRWVPAGQMDPFTGRENTGERGEWRGTEDPKVWEMAESWPNSQPGAWRYAETFAAALESSPKPGQDLIEVQVGDLTEWEDPDGKARLSWTFPEIQAAVTESGRSADQIESLRKMPGFISEIKKI